MGEVGLVFIEDPKGEIVFKHLIEPHETPLLAKNLRDGILAALWQLCTAGVRARELENSLREPGQTPQDPRLN